MMDLSVRPARKSDWAGLVRLREDAETRLKGHPSGQWQNPDPEPSRGGLPQMRDFLDNGLFYVVTAGKELLGCFALTGPDITLWDNEDGRRDNALYFNKAISLRGAHVGGLMLKYAEAQARLHGKGWLRLSCWTDNTDLCDHWVRQGFVPTHVVPGRWAGACFERPVPAVYDWTPEKEYDCEITMELEAIAPAGL